MVKAKLLNSIIKVKSKITQQFSGNNLRAQCARGGAMLGAGVTISRTLQLVRYMIMARLLVPSQLGLMAIVLAATTLFETIFEVGIKQSVIQSKRGDREEYLNVAWWFQAVRGFGLFVIAFMAAPAVSWFYDKPELLYLLRVTFLALVFKGLMSPVTYVLEKKFQFQKVVYLTQGSSLLGTLLTIVLAFFLRNIWALVIGFVFEAFLLSLLSFIICPFLPRLSIKRDCLDEILRFSRGMFGIPILTLIAFQTDIFVLGKLAPLAVVGTYSMAVSLSQVPRSYYVRIFSPLLLPAFSRKQDDEKYLCGTALKMTNATAIFGLPLAAFCVVCAGAILSIALGNQYATAAVPFGLFSIYAVVRIQESTLSSIYLAIGRPHLHRCFVALRAAILVCLIYPAVVFFGSTGAAASVLIAELSGLCAQVIWMQKRMGLKLSRYISCWVPGLYLAQIVVVPGTLLVLLGHSSTIVNLVTGGVLYFLSCGLGIILLRGWPKKSATAQAKSREFDINLEAKTKYA